MKRKHLIKIGLAFGLASCVVGAAGIPQAEAGIFEISLGFGFNRSTYTGGSYTWNRRWGAAIAYHFWANSGVEVAYQNVTERNFLVNAEDTTYNDQVYSLNWVQSFLGDKSAFQPYVKLGVGQLNRDISGTYAGGGTPPARIDQLTVVMAAGFKLYFLKNFALRTEAVSYVTGGAIATWLDNVAISAGISYYF
jgi:hypothetical protein